MYGNGAMLAVFLLIYSAIAGRIERSLISGPDRVHRGRVYPRRGWLAFCASTSMARDCGFWRN